MDHRIPKVGVVISIVLAIGALITFVFLNGRFQGPNPVKFLSHPYELTAKFADNKTLPTKQPVLFKGVEVGTITSVKWNPAIRQSEVGFTLNDGFRLRKDAVIRIGARSLLGDPYLAVVSQGSASQPALKSGDEVAHTETSVDFDEALSFLDKSGRRHVKSLIRTVADGTAAPGNGERLNGTLGGVARTISELHTLTTTLHGQEQQISTLVGTASTVLSTIGNREDSIRTIVSSGRQTLDALASNTTSLKQGLDELPKVLASGRLSLNELNPLLLEARPLFGRLQSVSAPLASALDPNAPAPLGATLDDLIGIARGLGPLSTTAQPVLRNLKTLLDELVPVVKAGGPGARNLVPALSYLTPRSKSIATGYALLASVLKNTDAEGHHYARLALGLDAAETADAPVQGNCDPATQNNTPNQGHCQNAYPGRDDALNPQPYSPPYSRIVPCTVPSRATPKKPCK